MKIAQKKHYENISEEEILKRVASYKKTCSNRTDEEKRILHDKLSVAIKGRIVSNEERKHHSEALKGRHKSHAHSVSIARKKSGYIYTIDEQKFLSWKEAKEYIESIGSFVTDSRKFRNMVDNKSYNFLKEHNIGYTKKECQS
jgi:Fe-S cluster assembly iron-binding protein IscA